MVKQFGKLLGVGGVIVALSLMTALFAYANQYGATGAQHQQEDERAYLGVQIHDTDAGVTVAYVFPESAAEIAGVEIDDVILSYNDVEIATVNDLLRAVENSAPGDSVVLSVQRGDETLELTAELTTSPLEISSSTVIRPGDGPIIIDGLPGRGPSWGGQGFRWNDAPLQLGVNFTSLTPEIAASEELTVEEGALITEVVADTPAEDAGLAVGDVITAVDDDAVDIEHTLSDRLYAYEAEDRVILTVQRGDETLEIGVVLASDHPAKRSGFMDMWPGMMGDHSWSPFDGAAFPWLNHPIQIDGLPIDEIHFDGNIGIQMSTEPPNLEDIPEGASVYACAMMGTDHTMYIITEGLDELPMLDCELYIPSDIPEVEQVES